MKNEKVNYKHGFLLLVIILISYLLPLTSPVTHAQTASEIQSKIDQRNQDIANLEKEIADYQKQLDTLGSQSLTLTATIKSLTLTKKKLEANISLTQDKIAARNLEIERLGSNIANQENSIADDRRIIRQAFLTVNEMSEQSVPAIILSGQSISETLDSLERLGTIQANIYGHINSLEKFKSDLEANQKSSQKAKTDLVTLNNQLNDQRAIVLSTTKAQTALLKETNQSEASYKQLLAQKKAQEAAFQNEINSYESQLHILVNPTSIPHTGSGVLSWPLDKIFITQYFGNTPFATANPQIYNGKGHTGVDFRASIGTPVKAALSGVIIGEGNTDLVRGCYSYGQWIMIKHSNGLSTLYAHLSLQTVSIGQEVATGQQIAYSGNTGYSTGPHLHFGVYATQGVEIKKFDNSVNCKGAIIPIADFSAYLNPLSFL